MDQWQSNRTQKKDRRKQEEQEKSRSGRMAQNTVFENDHLHIQILNRNLDGSDSTSSDSDSMESGNTSQPSTGQTMRNQPTTLNDVLKLNRGNIRSRSSEYMQRGESLALEIEVIEVDQDRSIRNT